MTLIQRLSIASFLLLLLLALPVFAQQPTINKVDPPNWWVQMPSPMLLVRGENLSGATFSARGGQAHIAKSKVSANGHWAFLYLATEHAQPGTLHITVHTQHGEAEFAFTLAKRRPAAEGFAGFSPADVMYLIMPDRFADGDVANDALANFPEANDRAKPRSYHGGDLRGIEQHLDYLKQLGVTTIWTTPLYDNSANGRGDTYHGYSATDLYGVDPHLGTLADYQHLVAAVHAKGMKAVLDIVPNHIGPAHPWVADSPTPDWLHGTREHHIPAISEYEPIIDPHGTDAQRFPTQHGWFADVLPDMNTENPLVKKYLTQNAVWWVESVGLDGLRIDTFAYVNRSFWTGFHQMLHTLYPHLTTVGEIFNGDPTIVAFFAGGETHDGVDTGLDTPFDFPTRFALIDVLLHDAPMTRLSGVLARDWLYPHPERLPTFLSNHDTMRFLSQPGATPERLKLGFGLLATLRGMPQLYYGDEIAMIGGDDPDNRRDFPGGFPGDQQNAFTAAGRTPQQAAMHDWVASLFTTRAQHPALTTGTQQDLSIGEKTLVFSRTAANSETLLIAVNNSGDEHPLDLDLHNTGMQHEEKCAWPQLIPLLAADQTPEQTITPVDGVAHLKLSAWQFVIYRADWKCQ
jgi:glycosidase